MEMEMDMEMEMEMEMDILLLRIEYMKKTQAIIDILTIADDLLTNKEEAERLISELEMLAEWLPSINDWKANERLNEMLGFLEIRK